MGQKHSIHGVNDDQLQVFLSGNNSAGVFSRPVLESADFIKTECDYDNMTDHFLTGDLRFVNANI